MELGGLGSCIYAVGLGLRCTACFEGPEVEELRLRDHFCNSVRTPHDDGTVHRACAMQNDFSKCKMQDDFGERLFYCRV